MSTARSHTSRTGIHRRIREIETGVKSLGPCLDRHRDWIDQQRTGPVAGVPLARLNHLLGCDPATPHADAITRLMAAREDFTAGRMQDQAHRAQLELARRLMMLGELASAQRELVSIGHSLPADVQVGSGLLRALVAIDQGEHEAAGEAARQGVAALERIHAPGNRQYLLRDAFDLAQIICTAHLLDRCANPASRRADDGQPHPALTMLPAVCRPALDRLVHADTPPVEPLVLIQRTVEAVEHSATCPSDPGLLARLDHCAAQAAHLESALGAQLMVWLGACYRLAGQANAALACLVKAERTALSTHSWRIHRQALSESAKLQETAADLPAASTRLLRLQGLDTGLRAALNPDELQTGPRASAAPGPERTRPVRPAQVHVSAAQRFIEARLPGRVTVKEAAEACGITTRTLELSFQSELGQTVKEWIQSLRFSQVADRLVQTDDTVQQVAQAAGFSSAATFCRQFRRWSAETPSAFRHKARLTQPSTTARTLPAARPPPAHGQNQPREHDDPVARGLP